VRDLQTHRFSRSVSDQGAQRRAEPAVTSIRTVAARAGSTRRLSADTPHRNANIRSVVCQLQMIAARQHRPGPTLSENGRASTDLSRPNAAAARTCFTRAIDALAKDGGSQFALSR
jgi:hypothetical protein